jgi:tripartite-type tricarboxylate transporter receptor subunit TctC
MKTFKSRAAVSRRTFVLGSLAAWAASGASATDNGRPLRLIVPTAPGSATDALARALSAPWARVSARPVVIDNIAGAGTTIGTGQIARAPKDGNTLGIISANHTINPWLYKKLPYDTVADFTPIAMIGHVPAMLVAGAHVPANSIAELVRLARSLKRPLLEGVVGGTVYQMAGELFKNQAGFATTAVPYKSSAQILTELLAGIVDLGIVPALTAAPQVAAGKLKGLGVTTSARTEFAPEVPTLAESGAPGFKLDVWLAVVGPAGLSAAQAAAFRKEIDLALADPAMKAALRQQGVQPMTVAPADMLPFFRKELERNRQIIQRVGITIN